MILEAMKMENVIKATGNGVVDNIKVGIGDSVNSGQTLITFVQHKILMLDRALPIFEQNLN